MGSVVGTTQRRPLPLMWLGDFETAVFAGSKRRHHVPAQFCRRLRSIGTAYSAPSFYQKRTAKKHAITIDDVLSHTTYYLSESLGFVAVFVAEIDGSSSGAVPSAAVPSLAD
ncbi:hypothetical protein EFT87_08550 [Schleiferilactobacillus harbinensis]|nr:hypothetical protein [Schleiferilactobacillus harbinensis]